MKPKESELRDKTIELIKSRSVQITYETIAEKTGLSVRWVEEFANGRISNPGVCSVEAVYHFLTNEPIFIR